MAVISRSGTGLLKALFRDMLCYSGEAFLQVSAFQVVMYYIVQYGTEEAILFPIALVIVCLELFIVIVQNVP